MITMPNIDQHIWNIEFLILNALAEYQQHGEITIDLNNEGPDAAELDLYNLLDHLCHKFNIDKKLVKIKTRNLLEQHSNYQIVKDSPLNFVKEVQTFAAGNKFAPKQFDTIKHFGLFVSRSNWQRLWLSAEMFDKFKNQTLQTFLYNPQDDYHKPHLGFDRLVHELHGHYNFISVSKLVESAPVTLDHIEQFPILTPKHFDISKHYHRFFIDIVCETFTAGRSFFPTEKTWRPIVCKTPFMIQGPVGFLENLRRIGLKTFNHFWDESYDEDGGIIGIKTILRNIQTLHSLSQKELQTMYHHMLPILDHNYNTVMNMTNKVFDVFK